MECKSIQRISSSSSRRSYDVFVSFRGEDTRNNFTDHLFAAFQRKGIVAFRDDTNLEQGERISTELIQAIEGSRVLVAVFSKNYANSSWCLQELAKIVDCMKVTGQSVLPVFYDVSPSEVRKQSGDYGEAFAEHEERFKQDLGMVQTWREALKEVADLSGWDVQNRVIMHDKLQELGWKIVRQDAPSEPCKWSRIWRIEDFQLIMPEMMVMDNVEAIVFQFENGWFTTLRTDVLSRMNRLRLILITGYVKCSGSLTCLSNELRYLGWERYPLTYFPSRCETSKLVVLHLPYSKIKKLWEGRKALYNLKIMNLFLSENLVKIPDLSLAPNLEVLNLEGCTKLVHIHPSIGLLRKLAYLNLKNCASLQNLPNTIFDVSSLESVNLQGCSKIFQSTSDAAIQCQSTFSAVERLKLMLPLHLFNSRRHNDKVGSVTPSGFAYFNVLRKLDLSYCNLFNIPEALASLYCLEVLRLAGNHFVKLPCIIKELPSLISLNLDHCRQLTSLSDEFPLCTGKPLPKEFFCWEKKMNKKARVGLYIFNCPKLVGMEGWSSIALSWMIQFLKVHKETSPAITVVIPGTRIPSWFSCQSVGPKMERELFPSVHDCNWIGSVMCVPFVTNRERTPDNSIMRFSCFLVRGGRYRFYVAKGAKTYGVTVESSVHHLCLFYLTRQQLIDIIEPTGAHHPLPLEIVPWTEGLINSLYSIARYPEVERWGMRNVFKQDLEEHNGDEG